MGFSKKNYIYITIIAICIIFLGLRENPCFLEIKASAEPTPAAVVRKTPAVEQFLDLSGGCFEA